MVGVNPVTDERVLKAENVERVLSVMSTCGMYDYSGEWIFNVGLPAKSGVGGGVMGVLPGQLGVAVFSPRLDPKGNSVRGVETFKELSKRFNLHLFNYPVLSENVIRRIYRLSEVGSNRQRPKHHHEAIKKHGGKVVAIEMQGDLFYSAAERLVRAATEEMTDSDTLIVDLGRVGLTDSATADLLQQFASYLTDEKQELIFVDPSRALEREKFDSSEFKVSFSDDLDVALERCEDHLIKSFVKEPMVSGIISFHEFDIFEKLTSAELSQIEGMLEMAEYDAGERIVCQGDEAVNIFLLAKGSVSILHQKEEGESKSHRVAAFEPGVCFGDLSVVDGSPRSADVVADERSSCYLLSIKKILELRDSGDPVYPKLLRNLLLINVDRLRRGNLEISSLKG